MTKDSLFNLRSSSSPTCLQCDAYNQKGVTQFLCFLPPTVWLLQKDVTFRTQIRFPEILKPLSNTASARPGRRTEHKNEANILQVTHIFSFLINIRRKSKLKDLRHQFHPAQKFATNLFRSESHYVASYKCSANKVSWNYKKTDHEIFLDLQF